MAATTITTGAGGRYGYRQVLAVGEFRAIFAAHVISFSGDVIAQLALAVLVFERTGSALGSSLTFALGFVPHLFGGTLLSSVADRFPVRRTLICCDLASAGLVALMALPGLPIPLLLALLLPLGAIAPVFGGARAASLPDVLGGQGFALGRSLLRMVAQSSQVGGFALGGVLLAVLSPRSLLLLDAASFVASAVLLRVGTRERPPHADKPAGPPAAAAAMGAPHRSIARDSLAGVRLALGSPTLRPLLLFYWLPPAFTIAPEALAAPYVARLGGSPTAVGLLLASAAAGSVAGMLTAGSRLSPSRRLRLMVPLATWTFVPLLCFVAHPGLIPAMVLLALSGLGWAYSIGLDQRLLDATPEHLRGRTLSLATSGLMLANGLGFAAAGAAAEFADPQAVIVASSLAGLLVVALLARPVTRALGKGMPGTSSPHESRSPNPRGGGCGGAAPPARRERAGAARSTGAGADPTA
jgi:predicted MFS family arabinose efflux permease